MIWIRRLVVVAATMTLCSPVSAQTTEIAQADTPSAETAAAVQIPNGAPVVLEVVSLISSETSQRDQEIGLRLAEPLVVNDITLAPAGAEAGGVILDAARARRGRPGKLVISARYLVLGDTRIPVRGAQLMVTGDHRVSEMLIGNGYSYSASDLYRGEDIEIMPGTRVSGQIVGNVEAAGNGQSASGAAEGQGQVLFFRPRRAGASALTYTVRSGETVIGQLSNWSSFEYQATPGIYEFNTGSGNNRETLRFEVEAGSTYYVQLLLDNGAIMRTPILRPSTRTAFEDPEVYAR